MPSAFDTLQNAMFDTVKGVYAFPATWVSVDLAVTWTGLVLFKNPTQVGAVKGFRDYDPEAWEMEYRFGDLPQLKERVDLRNTEEIVVIDGVSYYVRSVDTIFDGRTLKARLQPVDP